MNFIKRAWLATKAKKGRTALLILVTSAILIFVLAGLTIKNAADSAVESAKSEAGATVTLSVNREAMMKAFNPDSDSSSDDSSDDSSATTSVDLATAKSIAEKDGVALISLPQQRQQQLVMIFLLFRHHLQLLQMIQIQAAMIHLIAINPLVVAVWK